MSNIVIAAAQFASKVHAGQIRKDSKEGLSTPYFTHLARVAGVIASLPGSTEDMVCAAYLHDTIEDTHVVFEDIKARFGEKIAKMVNDLTNISKRDNELAKKNRAERKKADNNYLKSTSNNVKTIKLADRLDNMTDFALSDNPFKYKYAAETQDLLKVIGDANEELTKRIQKVLDFVLNKPREDSVQ